MIVEPEVPSNHSSDRDMDIVNFFLATNSNSDKTLDTQNDILIDKDTRMSIKNFLEDEAATPNIIENITASLLAINGHQLNAINTTVTTSTSIEKNFINSLDYYTNGCSIDIFNEDLSRKSIIDCDTINNSSKNIRNSEGNEETGFAAYNSTKRMREVSRF